MAAVPMCDTCKCQITTVVYQNRNYCKECWDDFRRDLETHNPQTPDGHSTNMSDVDNYPRL